MKCRFCGHKLENVFLDLHHSPPSNSFLNKEHLDGPEVYYPLKVWVCEQCYLVQVDEYKKAEDIFSKEYVYFSSYSTSWLAHCEQYVNQIIARLGLDSSNFVAEIASNDGYLLQYFLKENIEVLGIEPTANTAQIAREKGIATVVDYFGQDLAQKLATNRKADLIIGNNVLAHVPNINDFVAGLKYFLADAGTVTMEFPHLYQLVKFNQFDTVYHEHFSYLSLTTVVKIFAKHGLAIIDVEQLTTHGGSLRIYAQHNERSSDVHENVAIVLEMEEKAGIRSQGYYTGFQKIALDIKTELLVFLLEQKRNGKRVVGYGAAAKGNTLLNYCGIQNDLIEYVVDASPHKQEKYLPGSHIPVVNEARIKEDKPEFIIIFPWNIKEEIMEQLSYVRDWDSKFVIAIPNLRQL